MNLEPCPFCGKTESLMLLTTGYPGELRVVCNFNEGGCGGSTGAGDSEEEAIGKWNARAKPKLRTMQDSMRDVVNLEVFHKLIEAKKPDMIPSNKELLDALIRFNAFVKPTATEMDGDGLLWMKFTKTEWGKLCDTTRQVQYLIKSVCLNGIPCSSDESVGKAIAEAVAAERERCAQACVDYSLSFSFDENDRTLFDECAQFIRTGCLEK